MQPFIKLEVDRLLSYGYTDIGWREVSSECFGVPNAKVHIILVATREQSGVVDALLFSTVWSTVAALLLTLLATMLQVCSFKKKLHAVLQVTVFAYGQTAIQQ